MQECERRAIAEEKASRLLEIEKSLRFKEEIIAKLSVEQTKIKSQLTEKETRLAQQVQYEKEKFDLLQEAQQRLTERLSVFPPTLFIIISKLFGIGNSSI